jgi:hypothetical protein
MTLTEKIEAYLREKLDYNDGYDTDYMARELAALMKQEAGEMQDILACIPNNWCDSLLTGPKGVIHLSPCPEIEALLNGVRERIKALYLHPDTPKGRVVEITSELDGTHRIDTPTAAKEGSEP